MAPLRELAKKIPYEAYPILATVAFSLSFMVRFLPSLSLPAIALTHPLPAAVLHGRPHPLLRTRRFGVPSETGLPTLDDR